MTRTDRIWRCSENKFRNMSHLRNGVIKKRQLFTKQCKRWYKRDRLVCMLHKVHLVIDSCTAGIFACLLRGTMCIMTFGTAGSTTALCRLASGTTILSHRHPHSAYNDKGGEEHNQYVTEFLHKHCKDRKF